MTVFGRMAALMVAIGAACGAIVAAQAPAAAPSGQPALAIVCASERDASSFRVSVTNPTDRDLAILLGYTPGAPQPQVVNAVSVAVIRIATGATEEYVYVNPKYATYAGKKDPWIVPLKPGGSYSFQVPLRDFISSMNYNSLEPLAATGGRFVLESRVVAGQPGKVWTGKIEAPIESCS